MSIKKVVTIAVSLAVLALSAMTAVGCSDNGDDDGGSSENGLTPAQIQEIDGRLGAGASKLVGEWVFEHDIEDNYIYVTFLKSSGDACAIEFQKAGDSWLESGVSCDGTWRVEGNYVIFNGNYEEKMMYSVSGSNLTLTGCWVEDGKEECDIDRATRFDRNSIGATHIAKRSSDKRGVFGSFARGQ